MERGRICSLLASAWETDYYRILWKLLKAWLFKFIRSFWGILTATCFSRVNPREGFFCFTYTNFRSLQFFPLFARRFFSFLLLSPNSSNKVSRKAQESIFCFEKALEKVPGRSQDILQPKLRGGAGRRGRDSFFVFKAYLLRKTRKTAAAFFARALEKAGQGEKSTGWGNEGGREKRSLKKLKGFKERFSLEPPPPPPSFFFTKTMRELSAVSLFFFFLLIRLGSSWEIFAGGKRETRRATTALLEFEVQSEGRS